LAPLALRARPAPPLQAGFLVAAAIRTLGTTPQHLTNESVIATLNAACSDVAGASAGGSSSSARHCCAPVSHSVSATLVATNMTAAASSDGSQAVWATILRSTSFAL
jgi:hypothetical protein